jgi:hypothetical protein
MPKRSNEFQRLITLIEGQLAPIGATVEESAMLSDACSGQQREVDILIRCPVGERLMSVAIECRDHRRKADSTWMDQLRGKFESLPIDRLVAVSRCGFSAGATARAKLWNIETITLQSATKLNWAAAILSLAGFEVIGQHFTIERFQITLEYPADYDDGQTPRNLGKLLHLPDGRTTSLLPFMKRLVERRESRDAFMQLAPKVDSQILSVSVEFPLDRAVFLDSRGGRVSLTRVDMEVRCDFLRQQGFLQHGKYGEVAVAFGGGTIKGVPFNLALTECNGRGVNAALAFSGNKVEVHFEVFKDPMHKTAAPEMPPRLEFSLAVPVTEL